MLLSGKKSLRQSYTCRNFCHVWANCKNFPAYVVRGRSTANGLPGKGQYSFDTDMLQL
jgi:hypothetical protein